MPSVHLRTITQTRSVVYVTTELLRSFGTLVAGLGLNPDYILHTHYDELNRGITTWLEEGTLESIYLEIWNPAEPSDFRRVDVSFYYKFEEAGDSFYSDMKSIENLSKKLTGINSSFKYQVIVKNKDGASKVDGWGTTTLRSTEGLRQRVVGSSMDSPHITGNLSYWAK